VQYSQIRYVINAPPQAVIPFAISSTRDLHVTDALVYERRLTEVSFEVRAPDSSLSDKELLGVQCNISASTVHIKLLDVNDESPYFRQLQYTFAVNENTTVGSSIGQIHFEDPDSIGNVFSFEFYPSDVPFQVDSERNILLAEELDFESQSRYTVTSTLSDGRYSALQAANITLHVVNVNEFAPTFTQEYSATLLENSIPSEGIVTISARDEDAGRLGQIIRYELTGPHSNLFDISASGVIKNRQKFDFESDEVRYDIMATAITIIERCLPSRRCKCMELHHLSLM